MTARGFRLYLSPIVSSFTLLLFSTKRETLRTWGPVQGGKVAGCDVVYVVGGGGGAGAGRGHEVTGVRCRG
jgi:hypothetical protein